MADSLVPPVSSAPQQPVPVGQSGAPTSVQQTPQAPKYPLSGPHKEFAPVVQEAPVTEFVRPSEVMPELPQEVKEAGVETVDNHEHPQLTPDHIAAGLEPAKESTPVEIPQQPTVHFPYTPAQIPELKKTTDISDSKHWLVMFTEYLMKKVGEVKS